MSELLKESILKIEVLMEILGVRIPLHIQAFGFIGGVIMFLKSCIRERSSPCIINFC